jgi:DNA-binding transcriptional LysR family regulator
MITLRHIEIFHAIMRTGSITAAARLLNVTQPAISSTLKHFESRLQMKLFSRAGGRLQPTPEAEAIYPDIAGIFARVEAVANLAQDLAGGRLGTLSVAAAHPVANSYLPKAVASFIEQRPLTRVTLQSVTSPQVLDQVVNREVELGIAYEPVFSPEVEVETLMNTRIACVMPQDHPLAALEEIGIRDLAPYALITYLPQTMLRPHLDRAVGRAGISPSIRVQVGISLTGMMLAYHGAGIALVEPFLLTTMPFSGLVARPLKPRIEFKTLLIRHKSAPPSKAMTDFIAHLKQVVADDPGSLPTH